MESNVLGSSHDGSGQYEDAGYRQMTFEKVKGQEKKEAARRNRQGAVVDGGSLATCED